MRWLCAVLAAIAFALTGCSNSDPGKPPQSQQAREDQFWVAYEQRLGMVGRDYYNPVKAKSASIEYGYFLCRKLAEGTDPAVLTSRGTAFTREEKQVQLDTAIEFLCPEQR